ncbi:MAG: hypothetical protein AAF205_13685 [Pseudomonadota bacterium]
MTFRAPIAPAAIAISLSIVLAGCTITGNDTADAGITGAGAGAVVGAITGAPLTGALVGGAAGIIGERVFNKDKDDDEPRTKGEPNDENFQGTSYEDETQDDGTYSEEADPLDEVAYTPDTV